MPLLFAARVNAEDTPVVRHRSTRRYMRVMISTSSRDTATPVMKIVPGPGGRLPRAAWTGIRNRVEIEPASA
jgi:hypothetical protein